LINIFKKQHLKEQKRMVTRRTFFVIFKISKESITTEAHLKSTETEVQLSPFIDTPLTSPYALLQSCIQLRTC